MDPIQRDVSLGDFSREFDDLLRDLGQSEPHSANALESPKVPMSTTFYPGAAFDGTAADTILISSDSVYFYVSSARLISSSYNGFNFHFPFNEGRQDPFPLIEVPEASSVINIVLHAIYDISCSHHSPTFEDIESAVAALGIYGMNVRTALSVNSPLYVTVLSFVPTRPIDVYALAAKYDLADLAERTSGHLMSLQLSTITDELAEKIGSRYLKKLFFLHLGRTEAVGFSCLLPINASALISTDSVW